MKRLFLTSLQVIFKSVNSILNHYEKFLYINGVLKIRHHFILIKTHYQWGQKILD